MKGAVIGGGILGGLCLGIIGFYAGLGALAIVAVIGGVGIGCGLGYCCDQMCCSHSNDNAGFENTNQSLMGENKNQTYTNDKNANDVN